MKTNVFSVFGGAQRAAAELLVKKGMARKIEQKRQVKPRVFVAPDGTSRCMVCLREPDECGCESAFMIAVTDKAMGVFEELVGYLED